MGFAELVLKLTLDIFMVGNLFDMGLRLHLSNAMEVLKLCVVQGMQAFNLGVPILIEESR